MRVVRCRCRRPLIGVAPARHCSRSIFGDRQPPPAARRHHATYCVLSLTQQLTHRVVSPCAIAGYCSCPAADEMVSRRCQVIRFWLRRRAAPASPLSLSLSPSISLTLSFYLPLSINLPLSIFCVAGRRGLADGFAKMEKGTEGDEKRVIVRRFGQRKCFSVSVC